MTILDKGRLDVIQVVADSAGLPAALLAMGKPLSAFSYCLVALTGTHDEILQQAKNFRLAASEVTALPLALLPSLRRRTVRELKRQGWACLWQPFDGERIRECLSRTALKSSKHAQSSFKARLASVQNRVLVAEDNAVNQTVARRMLERLGCEVDIVNNGNEAVTAAAGGAYDVIFMDCQMPEMDGFQATEAIRKAEQGRHRTPVIAMTAHAIAGDRELCLSVGMDDYVSKPVRLETLSSVLGRWLRMEPAPQGIAQLGTALGSSRVFDQASLQ